MRKLITACMALAAFLAFAVMPSVASATNDPDLTHPTGTLLATGAKIKGTNVGETLMTDASGNVLTRCTTAVMTGELVTNNGSEVQGSISSATFSGTGTGGECTSSFGGITVETTEGNGVPWCLRSGPNQETHKFEVRGNSCANKERGITFVLNSTTVGKCKYERASGNPITGTYTTHPEDAVLHISGVEFPREEGGFLCPAKGFLDMTFTLETDTPTPEPLYIS